MAAPPPGAMLFPRMEKRGPFTIDTPGVEAKEGETKPKRNARCKDGLITTPAPDVTTLYELVRQSAKKFGNADAIGTRKLLNTHIENKKIKKMVDGKETEVDKKWTYFEYSGYSFYSFQEFEKLVDNAGAGLKHLGLGKDKKIHVYGSTR